MLLYCHQELYILILRILILCTLSEFSNIINFVIESIMEGEQEIEKDKDAFLAKPTLISRN